MCAVDLAITTMVSLLQTYLLMIVMGPVVPLMLLVAPFFTYHQLTAWLWIGKITDESRSLLAKNLVHTCLVYFKPVVMHAMMRVGCWGVIVLTFIDLQFSVYPMILYSVFAGLEPLAVRWAWAKHLGKPFHFMGRDFRDFRTVDREKNKRNESDPKT